MKKRVLIALPAFNEGKVIGDVIKNLKKEGFKDILVIDDCSSDDTSLIAQSSGAHVLKHIINRGAGAATATAIEYAKQQDFDFLLLMDSDGQHSVKDAKKLLNIAQKRKVDMVIGSRLKGNKEKMPMSRKIANYIGSFATWFVFGKYITDSQSGFRVINKKAIKKIKITYDRFEFCSEMIGECFDNNLKIIEVPIKVIYSDHSLNKGHGQSIKNGFTMLERFLFR